MRTISAVLLVALCACSSTDPNDNRVKPEIQIVELYGPSDLRYARGQNTLDAEYGFRIANRSAEELTLRRIDLSSTGSGAYVIRREDRAFNSIIPADTYGDVRMNARVFFNSRPDGTTSTEPVTIRAVLYFDSPSGSFRQILIRNLGQFGLR
jgi:hypothetical protein